MSLNDVHPKLARKVLDRALRRRAGRPKDPNRDDGPRGLHTIECTELEWETIELLAHQAGITASEWIRLRSMSTDTWNITR